MPICHRLAVFTVAMCVRQLSTTEELSTFHVSRDWQAEADNEAIRERNAFERSGRWGDLNDPHRAETNRQTGKRYDPFMWYDRLQYADSHRRRLAQIAIGETKEVQCPDSKTVCRPGQVCVGCFCTTYAMNSYIGGRLYMANKACEWSDCKCGTTR
ncbi:hypothetical protein FOL47_001584 [Perkinsus chesapeaki]|uniref:Uncharacterized protein n=1 Tax=Perkinsus chesapeaki TaxID=330153 RepID=A0A7J6MJ88_PERCH|nr:hypothetical protein FOL47_001584 [Perkinsus chesapeaki]